MLTRLSPALLLPVVLLLVPNPDAAPQDEAEVDYQKALAPLSALAGEHRGKGRAKMGGFQERWNGEWINGKTAILLRTESRMGRTTVFQDLRVFTWDAAKKRLRMRQFADGGVRTYDVKVEEDGKKLVFHQQECEGKLPEWRYTLSLKQGENENQVHYRLDQKAGEEFKMFVTGRLVPKEE